jgi:hypothetical protein
MNSSAATETNPTGRQVTGSLTMNSIQNGTSPEKVVRLQIGDICCALEILDFDIYNWIKRIFHEYETEQPPDLTIQLQATDRLSLEKLENSVFKSKFMQWRGRSFITTHGIMSGSFDPEHRMIKIKAEKKLGNPELKINHLNRLMSLAYYTGCKLKYDNIPPAMFVHSCGIFRNGQVFLFTGPSEVGKTTVARLCGKQDGEVVSDEMVLVHRPGKNGDVINVQSTPVLGTFPPGRKMIAPLRCIFFLKQADQTRATPVTKTDVYTRLLRQVISPACVGQKDKKTIYSMMADFSAEVAQNVPAYELEFKLDADALWRTVGDIEKTFSNTEAH